MNLEQLIYDVKDNIEGVSFSHLDLTDAEAMDRKQEALEELQKALNIIHKIKNNSMDFYNCPECGGNDWEFLGEDYLEWIERYECESCGRGIEVQAYRKIID